jgi:putative transcriptional regulator
MSKNVSLLKARKEHGFTQKDLADKLNVEKSTISNWENGYSTPRLADAFRVADLLGKDVNELFFAQKEQESHTNSNEVSTS